MSPSCRAHGGEQEVLGVRRLLQSALGIDVVVELDTGAWAGPPLMPLSNTATDLLERLSAIPVERENWA